MFCLDPPLEDIPEGDWFCPRCIEEQRKLEISFSQQRKKKSSPSSPQEPEELFSIPTQTPDSVKAKPKRKRLRKLAQTSTTTSKKKSNSSSRSTTTIHSRPARKQRQKPKKQKLKRPSLARMLVEDEVRRVYAFTAFCSQHRSHVWHLEMSTHS